MLPITTDRVSRVRAISHNQVTSTRSVKQALIMTTTEMAIAPRRRTRQQSVILSSWTLHSLGAVTSAQNAVVLLKAPSKHHVMLLCLDIILPLPAVLAP